MSLRTNILANYFGQGWTALMNIAFVPAYISYLGIEAYGLIGFFVALQTCLSFLDMGMTPTLNRETALYTSGTRSAEYLGNLLRTIEVMCFSIGALIALTVHFASDGIAGSWIRPNLLSSATVSKSVAVMGLILALRLCEGIYRGALLGLQKQVSFNVLSAAFATLRYGGVLAVLAWISPTIYAFFVWQVLVSIGSLIVLAIAVYRGLPPSVVHSRFSQESLRRIWRFAGGMMGIAVLSLLLTQLDKLLLSRLVDLKAFGYYTLAAMVAATIYMVIAPITQAVYPRLVEMHAAGKQTDLVSLYHHSAQFVTVITAPVVVLLSLHAESVVFVWSGDMELARHVGPVLAILSIGAFLNGLMHIPYQLQLSHGWVSFALRVNIIAVICMVPAIIWSVSRYGTLGAAYCWLALNAGYALIGVQFMHRRLLTHEKWRWYFYDVLLPIVGAFACAIAMLPFRPTNMTGRPEWLVYLLAVGVFVLMAAGSLSSPIRKQIWKTITAPASS